MSTTNFRISILCDLPSDKIAHIHSFFPFSLDVIHSVIELKEKFSEIDFLIVLHSDKEVIEHTFNFIRNHKTKQYIILCFGNGDTIDAQIFKKALKSNVDDYYLAPIDFSNICNKIKQKIVKKNTTRQLCKVKELPDNELLKMYETVFTQMIEFYNGSIQKSGIRITHPLTQKDTKQLVHSLNYNKSFLATIKIQKLNLILNNYYHSIFTENFKVRIKTIKEFVDTMLQDFLIHNADQTIIPQLNEKVSLKFKHDSLNMQYEGRLITSMLMILLELELKIMGCFYKKNIQSRIFKKSKDLRNDTLHLMMASSADKLNNLTSSVNSKYSNANKLFDLLRNAQTYDDFKIQKYINLIDRKGDPLDELKQFLIMQSNMFLSYNNHESTSYNIKQIYELIDFIFVNGFAIKNRGIKFRLTTSGINSELKLFKIDENILLSSLYGILENAIESHCRNITINFNITNNLLISISNDGDEISQTTYENMFNYHYTTKNQFGVGLNIIKNWLNTAGYKFSYSNFHHAFIIEIQSIVDAKGAVA